MSMFWITAAIPLFCVIAYIIEDLYLKKHYKDHEKEFQKLKEKIKLKK